MNKKDKNSGKIIQWFDRVSRKPVLTVLLAILVLIFMTTGILTSLSPYQYLGELNKQFRSDSLMIQVSSNALDSLKFEEAFLKSRLTLSSLDSISLVINLKDSLATLEIKGVVIYSVKIEKINQSLIFNKMDPRLRLLEFTDPMQVSGVFSTIPKEQYMVKNAPADTSDLQSALPVIDTVITDAVCYIFYFENGLQFEIRQLEAPSGKVLRQYDRHNKRKEIFKIAGDLLRFKIPDYRPQISIEIRGVNARTIFRALPVKPAVVLKF
ncbi:MAG: hypothetical protein JW731_07935 [Bacteroidales bacterium]|nr:hypothetical protein [Bacteroidales bacterium]